MKGHDEAIVRLRAAVKGISIRTASDAFIASLTMTSGVSKKRCLQWRGVLPALVMARHLPDHDYVKQTRYSSTCNNCAVCGFNDIEEYGSSPEWLANQIYALGGERPVPTENGVMVFNRILAEVALQQKLSADGRVRRAELSRSLSKVIQSNKYQRMDLLDALGRCAVLAPPGEGFLRSYVRWDRRREGTGNNEFAYPFALWEARMGFDRDAVRELFPQDGIVVDPVVRLPPLDEPAARRELLARSASVRGGDKVLEVLFAIGGLWIARLEGGRHALCFKAGRRWRWITGSRDEVLASVPEVLFEEAVTAVMGAAD